jgi:predicted signal transduction protein with EAL and GGDEF domain
MPEDVLETADRALYQAKAAGGNRVVFSDEDRGTKPKVISLQT